jgi:hypothetical protein
MNIYSDDDFGRSFVVSTKGSELTLGPPARRLAADPPFNAAISTN